MTGITNFFGNGTIKIGKVVIEETPLFDFEEQFSYAEGWEGTISNLSYDWNVADGEESLAAPDFEEQEFSYAGGWEGTISNLSYDWNVADGEESLAEPDLVEDFDTITGGWEV